MGRFLAKKVVNENEEEDPVSSQLSAISMASAGEPPADLENASQDSSETTESVADTKSILQKGSVIMGSVESPGSLFIYGTVNGNISCTDTITVDGCIEGNIKAANAIIIGGKIKGDIESTGEVTVQKEAEINGNLCGVTLNCDGCVQGNSLFTGKASVRENARICGDITCQVISISEGAKLCGKIQTAAENDQGISDSENTPDNEKEKEMAVNITDLKRYI